VLLYSTERDDLDNFYVRYQMFCFFPSCGPPLNTCYNMAKAGFYYTGNDLVVKCCACKLIVTEFRKGDDPFGAAANCSNCPFNIREMENSAASVASAASSSVHRNDNTGGFVSDTNTNGSSLPKTDAVDSTAAAATDTVAPLGESHTVIDKAKLIKENKRLHLAMTCKKCQQTSVKTVSTLPSSRRL